MGRRSPGTLRPGKGAVLWTLSPSFWKETLQELGVYTEDRPQYQTARQQRRASGGTGSVSVRYGAGRRERAARKAAKKKGGGE